MGEKDRMVGAKSGGCQGSPKLRYVNPIKPLFKNEFFIGVSSLYNVVLVSTLQQIESAMYLHISIFWLASLI